MLRPFSRSHWETLSIVRKRRTAQFCDCGNRSTPRALDADRGRSSRWNASTSETAWTTRTDVAGKLRPRQRYPYDQGTQSCSVSLLAPVYGNKLQQSCIAIPQQGLLIQQKSCEDRFLGPLWILDKCRKGGFRLRTGDKTWIPGGRAVLSHRPTQGIDRSPFCSTGILAPYPIREPWVTRSAVGESTEQL